MIRIKEVNANELSCEESQAKLVVNIIHNRFDLLHRIFRLFMFDDCYLIPVTYNEKLLTVEVGLYLNNIESDKLKYFFNFLFEEYPEARYIKIKHSQTEILFAVPYKYWCIYLPGSVNCFDGSLSSKVRYNTKWYPKKIKRELGDFKIEKFSNEEVPEDVINIYLEWKFLSHGYEYGKGAKEFIKEYGITDIYAINLNGSVVAVAFICVTGENVYFENFSYDSRYKQYSLGMVIYYHMICDLILLGKKTIYLSGGALDYKRRYNGVLIETYSGYIFRKEIEMKKCLRILNRLNNFPFFFRKNILKVLRVVYSLDQLEYSHLKNYVNNMDKLKNIN